MGNRTDLGDLYTTGNELNSNGSITIGSGATSNLKANSTTVIISDGNSNSVTISSSQVTVGNSLISTFINSTSFSGVSYNSLSLGGYTATNYYYSNNQSVFANSTNYYNIVGNANNVTSYPLNQHVNTASNVTFVKITSNIVTTNTASVTSLNANGGRITEVMAIYANSISGTVNVDLSTGSNFSYILGANVIFNFINPPAAGTVQTFMIICKQDGFGSRTITWPATVKWSGSQTPTTTTTAGYSDMFAFVTINGGSTYAGSWPMGNTAGF